MAGRSEGGVFGDAEELNRHLVTQVVRKVPPLLPGFCALEGVANWFTFHMIEQLPPPEITKKRIHNGHVTRWCPQRKCQKGRHTESMGHCMANRSEHSNHQCR
eukprot:3912666-Amphidinium_carterae.1